MRGLLVLLLVLAPSATFAVPDGTWVCRYKSPDQKQKVRLDFAGGQFTVDRGIGAIAVKNADITDDKVSWKDGVTYDFYPKEKRMTRTSTTGVDPMLCVRD